MAYYRFTERILGGASIDVYSFGKMKRDFTFIDDVVEGIVRVLQKPPLPDPSQKGMEKDPATSAAPFRIVNIGRGSPVALLRFIEIIENEVGKQPVKNFLPRQPGDVTETFADTADLVAITGFEPAVPLEEGIRRFVHWYRDYHDS